MTVMPGGWERRPPARAAAGLGTALPAAVLLALLQLQTRSRPTGAQSFSQCNQRYIQMFDAAAHADGRSCRAVNDAIPACTYAGSVYSTSEFNTWHRLYGCPSQDPLLVLPPPPPPPPPPPLAALVGPAPPPKIPLSERPQTCSAEQEPAVVVGKTWCASLPVPDHMSSALFLLTAWLSISPSFCPFMAEDSESTTCTDSDLLGVEFGELRRPKGVFVYDGTVYVADEMNHRVTQTTVADDNVIDAIRGNSVADLHSNMTTAWLAGWRRDPDDPLDDSDPISGMSVADLKLPYDVQVTERFVYIADAGNNRIVRWSRTGGNIGTIVAGTDMQDRPSCSSLNPCSQWDELNQPRSTVVHEGDGIVYVADTQNHRVMRWKIGGRRGTLVTGNCTESADTIVTCYRGNGMGALNNPHGLALFGQHLYIADRYNHRILKCARLGVMDCERIAGDGTQGGGILQLSSPMDVFVDWAGSVYIADSQNNRIVRVDVKTATLDHDENVTSVVADSADGGVPGDPLQFRRPASVFVRKNLIYIADALNHRLVVWCDENANIKPVPTESCALAQACWSSALVVAAVAIGQHL